MTWTPIDSPPAPLVPVMLRFGYADDAPQKPGFVSAYGPWYCSHEAARHHRAVHPTHWRELTDDERAAYVR